MQRRKKKRKISLETDQAFPKFLKQMREAENVLLEQLAEGLMTTSQLARIEKGQRPVCKNVRDRLLGRLGTASDLYENLLNIDDYTSWERERNILCAVEQKEFQRAQELINAYEKQKTKPLRDRIKKQFCLVMRAEMLKQQNAEPGEIGGYYETAVKLTVPDVDDACIAGKLLSIQEINMILEYVYYCKGADFEDKCKELMLFVEKALYDSLSKVKIYPKIVYYYLQGILSEQRRKTLEELRDRMEVCNRAIEMLRDTGRAYFLVELLEMKIEIMGLIGKELRESENEEKNKDLDAERQECIYLADLLKKLYAEYDVPAYMQDCVYLYQQRWVFYIGDVLRIRRKMCGFTQQKLCDGICSVKTLRRTERMQANMQYKVLGDLLTKLGLSKEFQRTLLVMNDREVVRLSEKLMSCRNNHELEAVKELLEQIRSRVSTQIPENQQYIMELEASLEWMEGRITEEEFAIKIEEALKCTLITERLFDTEEIYLTEMELLCISKRMQMLKDSEKRQNIDFLLHLFGWYQKNITLSECIVMYEYVMVSVASEMGNMGEYQSATELDKKVLRGSLTCKRVWTVSKILYDILWNEKEEIAKSGKIMEKEKMTETLKQCVAFSHFCRQSFYERFFRDKLSQSYSPSGLGRSLQGSIDSSPE